MNEAAMPGIRKYLAAITSVGAMFVTFAMTGTQAAELVMFERAGCEWCAAFDRDIAPIYNRSEEGLRAPLRRVDVTRPLPPDLAFIEVERFTPLFVLVEHGREIGRIRGYPGPESFWMQLSVLFDRLQRFGTGGERAQLLEKLLCANG
jgi:hypothetical protein